MSESEWNKSVRLRDEARARVRAERSFGRAFSDGFCSALADSGKPRASVPGREGPAVTESEGFGAIFELLFLVLGALFRLLCVVPAALGALALYLLPRVVPQYQRLRLTFGSAFRAMMRAVASYYVALIVSTVALLFVPHLKAVVKDAARVARRADAMSWVPDAILAAAPFLLMQLVGLLVCTLTLRKALHQAVTNSTSARGGTLLASLVSMMTIALSLLAVYVVAKHGVG